MRDRRIMGGWAAVVLVSVPEGDCFSIVQRIRDETKSTFVQVVDPGHVLNEDHLILALQDVVSAHKHRYNKMNRIDSELLLVMAGVNNFEEAVGSLAPRGRADIVLVVYSERRENVLRSLRLFEEYAHTSVREAAFTNDAPQLSKLMELYGIPEQNIKNLNEEELTKALAERAAVFYAKYR